MKSRVVATVIIEKDGKILLGKKSNNVGPYPNTWHLPGGGINLGEESMYDAVKREVKEETGLDADHIERVGFDEDYEPDKQGEMTHYIFLVFRITVSKSSAIPSDDMKTLRWFDKSELQKLSLPRPTVKFYRERGSL